MTLLFKYKKITTAFFCIVFTISLFGQEQIQTSAIIDTMSFITIDGESDGDYFGSSLSCAGDLNNDGFNDFIIGAPYNDRNFENAGSAYVYFGGEIIDNQPDLILPGEIEDGYFGESVSYAGDVNGDGFSDVIIGSSADQVKLYFGSKNMDSIPDVIFNPIDIKGRFGTSVSYAGDFNSDGFDDVIIGNDMAFVNGIRKGRAYLYYGGATMDTIPDLIFDGETQFSQFGYSVSYAGDINKDGFDDIMIGAPLYGIDINRVGRIYIFYGGTVNDTIPDIVFTGKDYASWFGAYITSAGDLNNDGYDDVIIGEPWCNAALGLSQIYIYFGGEKMDTVADITINDLWFCFGSGISSAGDINNDGYGDLMMGGNGKVEFYYGGIIMDTIAEFIIQGETGFGEFGSRLSFLGDINNDGFLDFLIGEPYYANTIEKYNSRVYIYSSGITTGINNNLEMESLINIYPNPFNTSTTIEFNIQKPEKVVLKIFNSVGQEIETLTNNFQTTGTHRIEWQPGNLPSGLYFCQIQSATISETKKLLLQK